MFFETSPQIMPVSKSAELLSMENFPETSTLISQEAGGRIRWPFEIFSKFH
jgi:hypothetical protein